MQLERIADGPLITPASHPTIGSNIQGPSVIEAPPWIHDPPGRYYLYFADHKGAYIRLAFADDLTGPWRLHPPGCLGLADSCFLTEPPSATDEELRFLGDIYRDALGPEQADGLADSLVLDATQPHIASPDVHVDVTEERVIMYFHGLDSLGVQVTRAATSTDGLTFVAGPEVLGHPYFRVFDHRDLTYALAMPGQVYRSTDPLSGFSEGPKLFSPDMRHAAVLPRDDTLHVFWTRVGDVPERILHSTVDLSIDWMQWRETDGVEVLRPEHPWEGADEPLVASRRSVAPGHVNQLRDPAVIDTDDGIVMFYAIAGESGIAAARITGLSV